MSTESENGEIAVRPVTDTGDEYAAFKIEQRGIDLIPDAEKKMKPTGLFWLWAGGVFNVEFLFYGTLIMTFGLSVPQAIAAILVGNLTYAFLGFASLQGPKTGTTAFMVSRAPFGQNGNRLVALFNWGTQVGFEIEGIYFVVVTVLLLFARGHTTLNGSGKVGIIILAVAIQAALPLLGHATISKIFRYMAYIFIVFFVVLAVFVFQRVHLSAYHVHPATLAVWTTALVLLTSVGGLGWTENGNDYSRYLPRSTPGYKTFWAAALGGAIPSILLEILGVLAYTVTTKTVGPAELPIPQTFASWFVVPFLIFAILQLLAINTVDLYSSGVTLQALGVPVKRWGAVIIDSVVCGVVVGIIVFHGNFYADFAGFLLYIIVWLSAWFGVFITDYVLRRRRYDPASLAAERGGLYWRNGGVHWPAIIALAAGMVAAVMWINAAYDVPSYTGPISNHFPGLAGGDFSWALGIIVSSLVYWALAARGVRNEADATPAPAERGGGDGGRVMTATDAFIARLPKAELHLHIEGTLERSLCAELAVRNGLAAPDGAAVPRPHLVPGRLLREHAGAVRRGRLLRPRDGVLPQGALAERGVRGGVLRPPGAHQPRGAVRGRHRRPRPGPPRRLRSAGAARAADHVLPARPDGRLGDGDAGAVAALRGQDRRGGP